MDYDILDVISEEISNNPSVEEMRALLEEKGFSQESIDYALVHFADKLEGAFNKRVRRNISLFTIKEFLDRIGYGFATTQFVNILFYQTILASVFSPFAFFIIGFFNTLKSFVSVLFSSLLQDYQRVQRISKKIISVGGVVFGFSFLFMALARSINSVPLFALSLLVGSVGVVSYGDVYNNLISETVKKERMGLFLAKISQYGVLITAVSMLLSGYLMDWIPAIGRTFSFSLFGQSFSFRAYGYLISFEITALSFIISGYVLSFIKQKPVVKVVLFKNFLKNYFVDLLAVVKPFFNNKFILLLTIASLLGGVVQTLGNSFFGIFIFTTFKNVAFGGFLNVAVIYAVAVVVSVFGPWITNKLHNSIGFTPMLVFGSLLIAMLPFFAVWSPNYYAIMIASSLAIIGSSILGVAHGLLARKLLRENERNIYFSKVSLIILLPYLFLGFLGSYFAFSFGLLFLFKLLVFTSLFLIVPLYLVLVVMANNRKL